MVYSLCLLVYLGQATVTGGVDIPFPVAAGDMDEGEGVDVTDEGPASGGRR
jgi:hypothetical protein